MELQIEDMAFGRNYSGSNKRKADFGAAGMTVTEERQRSVEFTDTYANSNQVAMCKRPVISQALMHLLEKLSASSLELQVTLLQLKLKMLQ